MTKKCTHKPLTIDCDRYTIIWNAMESLKREWKDIADQEELDMLNAIQKELEDGVVEVSK